VTCTVHHLDRRPLGTPETRAAKAAVLVAADAWAMERSPDTERALFRAALAWVSETLPASWRAGRTE
jgi:hypothetical protein